MRDAIRRWWRRLSFQERVVIWGTVVHTMVGVAFGVFTASVFVSFAWVLGGTSMLGVLAWASHLDD